MQLNSDQFKLLTKALGEAFTTRDELEKLTLLAFEKSLDQIAMGNDLEIIIFRMVKLAESTNQLRHLIDQAHAMRQQDPVLRTIYEEFKPIIMEENRDHRDNTQEPIDLESRHEKQESDQLLSYEMACKYFHEAATHLQNAHEPLKEELYIPSAIFRASISKPARNAFADP